jgi:hypothetical protein
MPRQHEDALIWSQRVRGKPLSLQRALKDDATKKHLSSKERCLVLSQNLCWSCHAPEHWFWRWTLSTRMEFTVRVTSPKSERGASEGSCSSTPSLASTTSGESRSSFASFDTRVSSVESRMSFATDDSSDECKGFCTSCHKALDGAFNVRSCMTTAPSCC